MSYNGQLILTEKYGDFIVDYWSYLVRAIEASMENGWGTMYLLDPPMLDGAINFFKGLSDAFSDSIDRQYGFKEMYEYCLSLKKQYFGE